MRPFSPSQICTRVLGFGKRLGVSIGRKKNAPSFRPTVDSDAVYRLAGDYLDQIQEHPKAFRKFEKAELTLLGLTIDFGNTIGFWGLLQTVLDAWSSGLVRMM